MISQPKESLIAPVFRNHESYLPAKSAGQLALNGVTYALEYKWVLTLAEQQEVVEATTTFNQNIKSVKEVNRFAFVNVNTILNIVAATPAGFSFDKFNLNARLVFGGAFSLDGIHPTVSADSNPTFLK